MFVRSILLGIASGTILGSFLKAVEVISGSRVYTLLLNVDFLPIVGKVIWPEFAEFSFHLVVSILIAVLYNYALQQYPVMQRHPGTFALVLILPAVFLYFPLSHLASKPVPEMRDMLSFSYWTFGHLLYAASIYLLSKMNNDVHKNSPV